jgi:hypothetical protein
MKFELSHQYSDLDRVHQFGLVITGINHVSDEIYVRWVFYYLGALFGITRHFRLYPFSSGNIQKEYKFCNNAERQARMIYTRIQKNLLIK